MIPCKTTSPRFTIYKIFHAALILFTIWVMQAIYLPELIYGDSLALTWQANEDDDLAGYNIYCTSSQPDHDLMVSLGNVTECDLNDLALYENAPYVIALTAYDRSGNESDFSDPLYLTLDDDIAAFEDNWVEPPATLQFTPEAWYQSRWVTHIVFLSIEGFGSHFERTLTEIALNPSNAVIMMSLVLDETTINGMGILIPRWWAPVDSMEVTVTTGAENATEAMKIKHLPFMLEQDENPLQAE